MSREIKVDEGTILLKDEVEVFYERKRTTGWQIQQRREDRIRTAAMCKGTWHNLFNMTAR